MSTIDSRPPNRRPVAENDVHAEKKLTPQPGLLPNGLAPNKNRLRYCAGLDSWIVDCSLDSLCARVGY